jgi:hypothetical protein
MGVFYLEQCHSLDLSEKTANQKGQEAIEGFSFCSS